MADFVFNVGKGRPVELYNRVKSNDPAAGAFVIVILQTTGLESDAVLKDYDTLGAILAATNDEPTNANYARKTINDSDLAALPAPDDTNDRYEIDFPDQTWSNVAAGSVWAKLLVCYDPNNAGGADTEIIPLTCHDFAVTPDGTTIVAQVDALGFFRAA